MLLGLYAAIWARFLLLRNIARFWNHLVYFKKFIYFHICILIKYWTRESLKY